MIDFGAIFENLQPYLPYLGFAALVAFLVTPLVGKLGFKVGALDLPAHLRGRGDQTVDRRIHDRIVPKLTGIILVAPLILVLLFNNGLRGLPWGILAGLGILLVAGILDDKYDLSGKQQLMFQVAAAIAVLLSGVSITYIQVAGLEIDLTNWSHAFQIGNFVYNFIFPADLVTIIWIVAVINFVGWADGVDGVHGALTMLAGFTLLFVAIKGDAAMPAVLVFIVLMLGSNLGFYPFNLFPAKMFYSGSGAFVNGFFLAVASIMSTSKLATAIITLGVPLFDAALVILLRIKANPEVLRNPLKILSISDRNHLHHRLLDVGYSKNTVLLIEVTVMVILCFAALYFSGFENDSLALVGAGIVIIVIFNIIAIGRKRAERIRLQIEQQERERPQIEVKYTSPTTETKVEKYTY